MFQFFMIDSPAQLLDLRILESLHISSNRLEMNNNQIATIVNIQT